ncbi:MAG: acyl-CoA-binding protein [Flavobacteriales bacterium]|jgi:hypothetical protein
MNYKKYEFLILMLFLITSNLSFGQKYLLSNEELIYSFETQNGKNLMLAKDKNDKYIMYRYGTKTKIEFEYPGKLNESWSKFKYSFYLRGGGKMNEGMDLNYIAFINENYKYVIYDTYFSVKNKTNIGIKIIDLKTEKIIDLKGKTKTRKGTLVDFRDNKHIGIDDENELYD